MNDRGRMTAENWNSFIKGVWISFIGVVVAVLPAVQDALTQVQSDPESKPLELVIAFLASNLVNLVRLYLKP